jgi:hypothetical protein
MDAPRQKLMKDRATVVATTTLAVVVVGLLTSVDIYQAISILLGPLPIRACDTSYILR